MPAGAAGEEANLPWPRTLWRHHQQDVNMIVKYNHLSLPHYSFRLIPTKKMKKKFSLFFLVLFLFRGVWLLGWLGGYLWWLDTRGRRLFVLKEKKKMRLIDITIPPFFSLQPLLAKCLIVSFKVFSIPTCTHILLSVWERINSQKVDDEKSPKRERIG